MAYFGPTPKPTVVEIAEGRPGHRPLNHREPQPLAIEPDIPKHLDSEAKREWKRLVPILLSMRVLTEADGLALANLCQAYSILVKAHKAMQKAAKEGASPLLMKTPSGYIQQSPLIAIINSQVEIINRISREFGLTPAARSRITANIEKPQQDSLEAALLA